MLSLTAEEADDTFHRAGRSDVTALLCGRAFPLAGLRTTSHVGGGRLGWSDTSSRAGEHSPTLRQTSGAQGGWLTRIALRTSDGPPKLMPFSMRLSALSISSFTFLSSIALTFSSSWRRSASWAATTARSACRTASMASESCRMKESAVFAGARTTSAKKRANPVSDKTSSSAVARGFCTGASALGKADGKRFSTPRF